MAPSSSTKLALTSSPSSSSASKRKIYDVFVSFRGEDTRSSFVDHLFSALAQKGIYAFRDDDKLERGREISPELVKAIEESRFSIIVFSENYASSSWCLDELVKIMDCNTESTALPIFYKVDPSDVRKQRGSFAEAFDKHEKGLMENKVLQRWKAALSQAASLSGWDSRNYRHETELIKQIVEDMFLKLKATLEPVDNEFVGIDIHMKEINTHLSIETDDVKFLGIYGLGGIGKTTIATVIYEKLSHKFEGYSYLANVRENSKKHGLILLQKNLLNDILNVRDISISNLNMGSNMIKNRLCHKRVLVILDDVDHIDQLVKLAGKQDWFGSGSRIVITTRDEHLLVEHGVVERYNVSGLGRDESLELFSLKAFKRKSPPEDYMELSNNVLNYAKGLPLALTILGSLLCDLNKDEWNSALARLKKVPNENVTEILKISYDALGELEKEIFLDIACFFKGKDKDYVTNILDSCGFYPDIGIRVLIDRSLISMSGNNELMMHDLVQDMGRYIVRRVDLDDPGKWSRLWNYEDICNVLANNVGTDAVRVIMLEDFSEQPKEVNVRPEAFKKICNLRLLKIPVNYVSPFKNLGMIRASRKYYQKVLIASGMVSRTIVYRPVFNLFDLKMALQNVVLIDLSRSEDLTEIPNLTRAPNLEHLILDHCYKLFELHPSVGLHKRLKHLSLRDCYKLESLPSRIEMESLETLDLNMCMELMKLPESLGNMTSLLKLDLYETSIRELPSSIGNITSLKSLTLTHCQYLGSLPSSICKLTCLEQLLLNGCWNLGKLPQNLETYQRLLALLNRTGVDGGRIPTSLGSWPWVSYTRCLKLPFLTSLCSLRDLDLSYCDLSDEDIPSDIGSLSSLETLNLGLNHFVNLPSSISQLSRLTTLRLTHCKGIRDLPELPSSIKQLDADHCISLERLPNANPSTVRIPPKNVCFTFINCYKLLENQPSLTDAMQQIQNQALLGNLETFTICLPGNDIPAAGWFSAHQQQASGSSVDIPLPPNWYNSKLRGLAYCVLANDTRDAHLRANRWETGVGGGFKISKVASSAIEISFTDYNYDYFEHPHVVLGYISRAWLTENEERLLKATFRFATDKVKVHKCAIHLVYVDDDNNENENENAIRLVYVDDDNNENENENDQF